jgi:hypothetical protein
MDEVIERKNIENSIENKRKKYLKNKNFSMDFGI